MPNFLVTNDIHRFHRPFGLYLIQTQKIRCTEVQSEGEGEVGMEGRAGKERGEKHKQIKCVLESSSYARLVACLCPQRVGERKLASTQEHRQCFIIISYLGRPRPKYTPVKCRCLTCEESSPSGVAVPPRTGESPQRGRRRQAWRGADTHRGTKDNGGVYCDRDGAAGTRSRGHFQAGEAPPCFTTLETAGFPLCRSCLSPPHFLSLASSLLIAG